MRVSTAQFYLQSAQQMSQKTSDVNDTMSYLTSGKRVLTAKDDAVSFGTLAGYKNDLANIDQYKRNIDRAESHNNLQEVVFADAEVILDQIKQDMLLANNGRMSSDDLQVLADQVRNNFEQLLNIGNSKNENGDYIFSGYQTTVKPFSQQSDGTVVYSGDDGVNNIQVSKNIDIALNQTGDAAFLNVANAIGNFKASYPGAPNINTSGVALESANVVDRGAYNTSVLPHNYSFDFDTPDGNLTVTDSGGTAVFPVAPALPAPYVAGQIISFDGIEVTLSGNPLPGESLAMSEQEEISIFETVNSAIKWMEQGTLTEGREQHQVDYNSILTQLNSAMNHVTSRRVDAGVRLQALDNQKNRHLDTELATTTNRGKIEDLDFAKAISEFEQTKIALQASQQAFSKVQGLTLFNYI